MMNLRIMQFILCATCSSAYENMALRRPAWQENDYSQQLWGADKAVDGQYSNRVYTGDQCTISADKQQTATWRVDLQSVVSISYINIFYRTDNIPGAYIGRFAGFFLYVSNTTLKEDGHLCFHEIQTVSGTPTEDQRINCSTYGRYVIYYNERRPDVTYPAYYSQFAFNELCEVEVFGCPVPGYYGQNCNQTCSENCQGKQCDAVTGNCVNGCTPGYQGPHCTYLNLALGKPARQQNNWPNKPIAWGAAKAVDGQYSDRSSGGNQCTISADGKQTAEWRVDLQRLVSISHINIFYRTDNAPSPGAFYNRFAGFFLFVSNTTSKEDGHLCFHKIQHVNGTPSENQTINCPVHGRYVIYYNERRQGVIYPSYYSTYAYNDLCELEVYGCPDRRHYGEYCDKLCPGNCHEQSCNITSGHCLGCKPGYKGPKCNQICDQQTYGLECSLSCGNCSDGETCHHVNGTCPRGCSEGMEGNRCQTACQRGSYGKDCSQNCSENCGVLGRCSRLTGECEGGCQPGWRGIRCDRECEKGMYGVNCNQWCGHCLNDTHCHHVTGTCLQGCFSGHKGELCNIECDGGMYGENCSQDCGHCVNDTQCHHINGTCSGGCSSGYKELLCIKKCDGGMYGDNCSQTCGHCLSDTQCHHISGTCSKGCSIGYNGALCQEECNPNYYGRDCRQKCSVKCGVSRRCNRFTGECEEGCQAGWSGVRCDKICRQLYWGLNCNQTCSTHCFNRICHHESGVCEVYVKSQKLSEACNTDYSITIISVVISTLIVVSGSVLNYLIWKRNQRKKPDFNTLRQKDNSKGFSTLDIADQYSEGEMNTPPYAEFGVQENASLYEELHHYANSGEKM